MFNLQKLIKGSEEDESISVVSGRSLIRSRPTSTSMREGSRILHAGMISAPQNDFRHTLHVGDGTVFGDASFLGPGQMVSSQIGITRELVIWFFFVFEMVLTT
jgi:hypothetical protein